MKTNEIIQLLPTNEAIIQLMELRGMTKLEQVGFLTLIANDIANDLREVENENE